LNIFAHSSSAPEAEAEYQSSDCCAAAGRPDTAVTAPAAPPPQSKVRRDNSGRDNSGEETMRDIAKSVLWKVARSRSGNRMPPAPMIFSKGERRSRPRSRGPSRYSAAISSSVGHFFISTRCSYFSKFALS
jgi:hypothetical protein